MGGLPPVPQRPTGKPGESPAPPVHSGDPWGGCPQGHGDPPCPIMLHALDGWGLLRGGGISLRGSTGVPQGWQVTVLRQAPLMAFPSRVPARRGRRAAHQPLQ